MPGAEASNQASDESGVRELPGGHDWKAWRALWEAFLANGKGELR